MSLLSINGLQAGYGPRRVLQGVDLTIGDGQILVVLGANGAGKTTLLRAISGTIPRAGTITFDGKRIDQLSARKVVAAGIAHVPQGRGTFADLTVDENIRLGAYLRNAADAKRNRERWLTFFPRLRERLAQQAGSLSGGEQQMLAITRALMLQPRLLLLDEPSLGLAPIITRGLVDVLAAIRKETAMTMLIVEQNANLALAIADDGMVLESGNVVLRDTAANLVGNDEVRRIYLGYE
ncbi:ABC transporter ATP-binding protein [Bradyrhizobium sp. RD5-C2]|uniref:ABC transporter ATP-binding protein n=1 Tax=Bradyrhizobium sp. RD5-C2 TaxID=244562 RepID=UPI001CC763E4|nr:ABC transporter ATP-binding protein [Bradyrhizobium sp. RD5-C2]GIQ76931.1 ABC transporter ATP-binding protein [Bradyrhizobium sp. RD5-C2]